MNRTITITVGQRSIRVPGFAVQYHGACPESTIAHTNGVLAVRFFGGNNLFIYQSHSDREIYLAYTEIQPNRAADWVLAYDGRNLNWNDDLVLKDREA